MLRELGPYDNISINGRFEYSIAIATVLTQKVEGLFANHYQRDYALLILARAKFNDISPDREKDYARSNLRIQTSWLRQIIRDGIPEGFSAKLLHELSICALDLFSLYKNNQGIELSEEQLGKFKQKWQKKLQVDRSTDRSAPQSPYELLHRLHIPTLPQLVFHERFGKPLTPKV